MRKVLVITTGRADETPLFPVVSALHQTALIVDVCCIGGVDTPAVAGYVDRAFMLNYDADCVIMLGDRWELLIACAEALKCGIPIVHIHGGENTAGSFDDLTRDAISKLACLHFVAHESYGRHLERIGESKIFVTGAPGLDNLANLPPRPTEKEVMDLNQCVATWHPVTLADEPVDPLIEALEDYWCNVIWTAPNRDPGRDKIIDRVGAHKFSYMSPQDFVRECRRSLFVIGNSSMGIIEAPAMGVPSVNIGSRQAGRILSPSVINSANTAFEIKSAMCEACDYRGPFVLQFGTPGEISKRIVNILQTIEMSNVKRRKCESL